MFIKYNTVETGSQCNFNCTRCRYEKQIRREPPFEEIISRMSSIPVGENVEIVGGDPFIRKDIFEIMRIAHKRFSRVKFSTNGAAFYYKNILAEALDSGLKTLCVKFHSTDPAIHKAATRTDTLEYVLKGVENLSERVKTYDHSIEKMEAPKFAVIARIIVNCATLPGIVEAADYLSEKKFARLVLDCGRSEEINDELFDAVRKSIAISLKNKTWPVTVGLPPCALTDIEEHSGEIYRLERRIAGYAHVPGICERCEIYSVCPGVLENLADKREWKPIANKTPSKKMRDLKNMYRLLNWEEKNHGGDKNREVMGEKTKAMLVNLVYAGDYPPLSTACLIAYACKFDEIREKCEITHLTEEAARADAKELIEIILSQNPAIIGFSCYLWNLAVYMEIIPAIRGKLRDSLIILGGPEAYPELLLEIPGADAVAIGEGELTFKELLEKRANGLPWEDTRGLALRCGGRVRVNPPQPLIENLDDIPSPYLMGIIDPGSTKRIEYNRGCAYRCSFCYNANAPFRHYSLERIEEEMRDCVAGNKRLHFAVGTYLNSGEFGVQVMNLVRQYHREQGLFLIGNILIDGNRYDPEFFEALADSVAEKRLAVVEFGVQCCDRETIKLNSRVNNFRAIRKNAELLNRLKISSMIDLLLGMPGDNLLRVAQSLATVTDFKPAYIPMTTLRQIPNTAIFRENEKFGIEADRLPPRYVHRAVGFDCADLEKTALMAESFSVEYHAANRSPEP